jgi:hypothetical protein
MPNKADDAADVHSEDISEYLNENERRRLVASLHDFLSWIGVQPPDEFKIDKELMRKEIEKFGLKEKDIPPEIHLDKGIIDLRNLIWRLVNAKELTEREENEIKELINILKAKENQDEEALKGASLTRQQAKQLYNETEAIIRSLLELKEILEKKKATEFEKADVIKKKVDEIKRWNDYVDKIEK